MRFNLRRLIAAAGITAIIGTASQAVGSRYVYNRNVSLGGAFEFPVSEKKGLMENRMTFDLILQY